MRSAFPLLALALAAAAAPGGAAAQPCRGDRGDGASERLERATRVDAAARASAAWLGHASLAGLAVTSAAEGPVSLAAIDEAVDDGPAAAPAPPAEAPRAAPIAPPRRAPMCTGSADDDPRCQPVPPGPEQAPELRPSPARTLAPRGPATLGGPALAGLAARPPVAEGGVRPGIRHRLERPPRR